MKNIKYRVWDKYTAKMYYDVKVSCGEGYCNKGYTWWFGYIVNGIETSIPKKEYDKEYLMQYVGIKDKNKKEIYEYDIIRYKGENYLCEDIVNFLTWCGSESIIFTDWQSDEMEIIGNSHKNPELMDN